MMIKEEDQFWVSHPSELQSATQIWKPEYSATPLPKLLQPTQEPSPDRQHQEDRSNNPWTNRPNTRQQNQYNLNARSETTDIQYNKLPQNNFLSTPNSVQFIDRM